MSDFYHKAIKRIVLHIEKNLEAGLSLDELVEISKISKFHFHRMFTAYMGIPIGQYIKRKRIEKSMRQLAHTKEKTISVALSIGYESHAGFTKAFTKETGISPKEFKHQVQEKKGTIMTYLKHTKVDFIRFTQEEDQPLFSIRRQGNYNVSAMEAWMALLEILKEIQAVKIPGDYIGISHDNPHSADVEEADLRFDACVIQTPLFATHKEVFLRHGAKESVLPAGRYAVFRHVGPLETLGESYHYIYGSWMYTENQKLRDTPPLLRMPYVFDKERKPVDQEVEIYIPVK